MHHFARRTAAVTMTLAAATLVFSACSKNNDNSSAASSASRAAAAARSTAMSMLSGASTSAASPGETTIAGPNGDIAVADHILAKYTASGGVTSPLGKPTAAPVTGPDNGSCQEFEGGAICWSERTDAHIVWGDIRAAWESDGAVNGALGYPTSDEKDNPDGTKESEFTGGKIEWANGQTTVTPK